MIKYGLEILRTIIITAIIIIRMVNVGDRVSLKGSIQDSATVKYYGPTEFAAGHWAGVELDHKVGRNDGSIDGVRYFTMADRGDGVVHGLFTRLSNIEPLKQSKNTLSKEVSVDPNQTNESLIIQLQDKDKEYSLLQNKFAESRQKYEMHIEELQLTVDRLTLKDIDSNTDMSIIREQLDSIKDENIKLKEKVDSLEDKLENGENMEILDGEYTDETEPQELLRQNRYLNAKIKKLEVSSNDILQQYEESLDDNTKLLKDCIELKETVSNLKDENEQNQRLINELSEKFEAQENSGSIIDYLTESNNKLNETIKTLENEIYDYKQTIEMFNKSQSNHDNMAFDLQRKLETTDIELNKNISLLEDEYEKNITLTERLQTLTNTVYTTQRNEIRGLENKVQALQDDVNNEKVFKRFGEYYLNTNIRSPEHMQTQLQLLKFMLEENNDGDSRSSIANYILLYFNIFELIIHFLKFPQDETVPGMADEFVDRLFNFSKWRSSILERRFEQHDYNVNVLIDFISKYSLPKQLNFALLLLDGVFKDIIPNVFTTLRNDIDSRSMSNLYSIVLLNEDLIQKILPRAKNEQCQVESKEDIQVFSNLLEELFEVFLEMDVDKYVSVMSDIKQYLEKLNQQQEYICEHTEQNGFLNKKDLSEPTVKELMSSPMNTKTNPHDELINELKLKINILTEKSNESRLKEGINIQLKDDIQKLTSKLEKETGKVEHYNKELNTVTGKLEEIKLDSLQLIKDKKLVGTLMNHNDINKLDLITEIHYLKDNLLTKIDVHNSENAIKKVSSSLEWLKKDKEMCERNQYTRGAKVYPMSKSQQYHDQNMDRLLDSVTGLVSSIQVGLQPPYNDQTKLKCRIQRHDNIVKNVISELVNTH